MHCSGLTLEDINHILTEMYYNKLFQCFEEKGQGVLGT